jgi:hypothetical protein
VHARSGRSSWSLAPSGADTMLRIPVFTMIIGCHRCQPSTPLHPTVQPSEVSGSAEKPSFL